MSRKGRFSGMIYIYMIPDKIFFESKKKAVLKGSVVGIVLVLGVLNTIFQQGIDQIYVQTLTILLGIFLLCFILFIKLYPTAILEIYNDHFVYIKGHKRILAHWSEVNLIAFQINLVRVRGVGGVPLPSAFIIRTKDESTHLIETSILKLQGDKRYRLELVSFVEYLEQLSGQKVKFGDISINKFSEVNFLDMLKNNLS